MSAAEKTPAAESGIRLGRVGRVPVYLRPSWFLVAAAMTLLFAPTVRAWVDLTGPGVYLISFVFALILLLSVFVHEAAHALAAAATGTPATAIVLDLWGGHTAFDTPSAGPWRAVAVAVVGPLSNVVIALAAEQAVHGAEPGSVLRLLLVATATSNLVVAGFNALPGLPLDGGRVLEGLIWRLSGDRLLAAVVAGHAGRVIAVGTLVYAGFSVLTGERGPASAFWLVLVGILLWRAAGQAVEVARWNIRAEAVLVDDLLQPAVAVSSGATVAGALMSAAGAGATAVVVLDVYGRPSAIVDERAAAGVPAARAEEVRAGAVAEALPAGAVLATGLAGQELIQALQDAPSARYAVLGPGDVVVGVLDWEDVARFVAP
ncbi:site-2 protease family protein [Kineosporia sp. NBRC 101731]|uniref:site-2 protease family protein n=1 Tax=Kineosporia sp. NBRC 101731 TaxID=3032199 RepID=UPI0024A5D6AC|nr:site-2 protease family protein [Kineosporia sp. NBRC 101731]GLY31824.1 peptidase M50 [Kineosporia sp. NBRC 101731]